ncbi:hypothetical protein GCT19_36255 [Paraburkholderia sp. CNPSo 3155]|uniref:hypothetical protein n=1 Tax=Paraburkholderia atlantica TaxID=2654982 RepID=UPI00128D69E6|nr:hypothetical protein [Paraburkholderia atlantica]MPW10976.1 hypothetical protein [Paraburkholderia atlantica]
MSTSKHFTFSARRAKTPRRIAGRALLGFSAFVMFVTLTSLFNGQTPAHASETLAGAGLFIMVGLSIMLAGGAIMGPVTLAIGEIGLVLVSLASYIVFYCIWSYITLRLYFPQNPWHFVWDETLLWLIILGIGGFVLLGLSERRQSV